YDFDLTPFGSNFYDQPQLGAWPDAYYSSFIVYDASYTTYVGPQPMAFDRTKMLCGLPATVISPGPVGNPPNGTDVMLPSDLDGAVLPPPGAPNAYTEFPRLFGNNHRTHYTWHFTVGVPFGTGMSFTLFANPAAAPYACLCGCEVTRNCVPQLGSANNLD